MKVVGFVAVLALAGCAPQSAGPVAEKPAAEAPPAPAATPAPAKPSGPSRTLAAETMSDDLSGAAAVTDIHFVKDADVKLFSTAGGDPAINGLYTYVALYTAPDGWTRVFMLGDFNSWKVVEESPTRVVLAVSRSWVEEGTGDIKTADEKMIVDIPTADDGAVTVTPAS